MNRAGPVNAHEHPRHAAMTGTALLHRGLRMIALGARHLSVSTTAALTLAMILASRARIPAARHRAAHAKTLAQLRLQHYSRTSAKTAAAPKAPVLLKHPPPPKAAWSTTAASACPS